MGDMEPDRLFSELSKGGFGLVWYKDEYSRRYMEYSASFSLARYLAAGIPVIVPAGIASRSIIEENHLGLVVHSLEEAASAVEAMTKSEYQEYVRCVAEFFPALRRGYYTKKCLIEAMQAFYRKDAGRILIPENSYRLEDYTFTFAVLRESYGGNLALSWDCKGKPDGFLIFDEFEGTVLCDTRNVHQHYFVLRNCEAEKGFVVKAYLDTLRGKLIVAESEQIYLQPEQYKNPKVSLIMPAYNAEDYIIRSIDTALAQSFSDIELIIIDDGSTDHTSEIIDWYAEKNLNVIAIHQKNGGVAAARNTGIEHANGEYIGFMDNDDMLRPNMISRLYHSAKVNDCDIAITSIYRIENNGYEPFVQYPMEEDTAVTTEDFFDMHFTKGCMFTVVIWNKLYRTSMVKEHLFPLIIGDDDAWTPCILSYADKICYLNDCAYEWDRVIRTNTLVDSWTNLSRDERFKIHRDATLFYMKNGNPERLGILKRLAKDQLLSMGRYYAYDEYEKLYRQIEETF